MDSLEGRIAKASADLDLPVVVGFDPLAIREHQPAWWARVGTEPEKYAADANSALAAALVAHYADARALSRRRSFRIVGG